jgi:hypothetical protein
MPVEGQPPTSFRSLDNLCQICKSYIVLKSLLLYAYWLYL